MPEYFLVNADTVQPSAIIQTSEDGEETVLNDNGFGIKAIDHAGIAVKIGGCAERFGGPRAGLRRN
jgi:hypothetical protein